MISCFPPVLLIWSYFSGEAHVSYKKKEVPARQQSAINCRCKCFGKLSDKEKHDIFTSFASLKDHETQNVYLRGCVSVTPGDRIRRRPRKQPSKERNSFSYSVTVQERSITVCKAAFLGLHGIKMSRMKKKVLNFTTEISDKRGKHENHAKINDDVRNRIREHIRQFPARESHYSRAKNTHKKYLDSTLSVAEMHRIFIRENPDLAEACKYWLYQNIFNYEFNIAFGFPRSDICDTCEKQHAQIKAAELAGDKNLVNKLKVENEVHVRKADVFTVQINEDTECARQSGDMAVIAIDFEKNLPLPLTGIGQEYYKRQLWIHNFCIHDCVNDSATMYLYSEHFAGKGPNDVISCLDHYISELPQNIKKISIFADNCFSQNKNKYLFAYLEKTVHTCVSIQEIHIKFPLPGHSRMPCDRDFGRIEKKRRKKDKAILPSDWVTLIKTTDQQKPFKTVFVEHPLTDDMRPDGTPIVRVKDYKKALDPIVRPITGISEFRGAKFEKGKQPLARKSMTVDCSEPISILKRGQKLQALKQLRLTQAYVDFLPIKTAKYQDIRALLEHVSLPPQATFYDNLRGLDRFEDDEDEDE